MKSPILLACLLALALNAGAAVTTNSSAGATKAGPGNSQSLLTSAATLGVAPTDAYPLHIVTCGEDVDVDALLAEFQINVSNPKHLMRALKMFAALLDDAMIQRLKADPRIVAVEADGPVSLCGQVNPNGIMRLGIPEFPPAHINGTTEPIDVDVAILDTGINPHEDLNIYTNYSVVDETGYDQVGHGTAVAGVLGALDNGVGMVGVAPGVRIWNVKMRNDVVGTWTYTLSGMAYVLEHADKISVVNMSFVQVGPGAPLSAVKAALRNLVRAGVVVVAAVGNDGWDLAGPDQVYGTSDDAVPAAMTWAMAVSGMDAAPLDLNPPPGEGPPLDKIAAFSNYSQIERTNDPIRGTNLVFSPGGAIDVAAPAVVIGYLTWDDSSGYGSNYLYGTSLAAPHVAGLVALYIAANGRATNEAGVYRIRQAIVDASLPQSQWRPNGNPFNAITNSTGDPDSHPEPLAIASANWVPRPVITHTAGAPGNFQVQFATVPGYDYTVQSTTNLTAPIAWENLRTVSGGSNVALVNVTDTNAASQSFYRLARQASVEPPRILEQPVSGWAKLPGATATLNVSAVGVAPLGYFWQKDGSPLADGGNVSGAATASLVLTNVQSPDAGAYRVVVTNAYGSVTSAVATITILTNWTSALVTGVLATATSELATFGRYAANTVNDSIGYIWESLGVNQGFGEDRKPAITFDLGTVRRLETTVIWNGSEPHAAIKRMFIEVSTDGVSFSSLGEFTLTTLPPASETLSLGGVVGRYVRFTIREDGAGQLFPAITATVLGGGFAELDEVEFHEYQGN